MNSILTFCVILGVSQLGLAFVDKDVYSCLADNNYTSFAQLLKDARLDTSLKGAGPFTLLAPSNTAVTAIDPNLMGTLAQNSQLMKQILQYHIINAYEVVPSMISAGDLLTSLGQPVNVSKTTTGVVLNNSTMVDPTSSDLVCNNGIIHGIQSVMLPPIFSTNNLAAQMIIRDDIFKDLFLYILLSGLEPLIAAGEYTIFAPTDLAFGRYSHLNDINQQTPNAQMIYLEVLKYHIVPGARYSYQLQDGQQLYTLHGAPINIKMANGVMVDSAHVVEANIPASNGVIHAIDHVLYPADLLANLVQSSQSTP